LEIIDETILVAHNSSFDFRMLKIEFERLGYDFNIPQLCTVNLSKKLIPGLESYKLGKLVKSLGIPISNRHRASGDAMATVDLFKLLLIKDINKEIVNKLIKTETSKGIKKYIKILDKLKNITGIYYLYNQNNEIIYIGKSKNIRNRVNQHLSGSTNKSIKIQSEITSVFQESTGNELIALLKEAEEILIHKPKFNKLIKKDIKKFGIELCENIEKNKFLRISHYNNESNFIETFSSLKNANKKFIRIMENFGIKKDLCISNNRKIENYINDFSLPYPNMLIIDKGRTIDEKSVVLIKNSKYIGFGYFSLNYQINNYNILESLITQTKSTFNFQNLIVKFLKKNNVEKILNTDSYK